MNNPRESPRSIQYLYRWSWGRWRVSEAHTISLSRTFWFTAPGWLNDLPSPIRIADSLTIFKRPLKTHLFRHYLTSSLKKKNFSLYLFLPFLACISTLTLNVEHTTLFTLFIHHTYLFFFISNLHISDLYTHNCLYYILCFCYFVHCIFVYYYFIICVMLLSFCCTVELLSLQQIPRMCKHTWPIKLILILILILIVLI